MKNLLAIFLMALASTAFAYDHVLLPAEGVASAESIINCEAQVAQLKNFQKIADKTGTAYGQINPGSDSFFYFFTGPGEPAHPAMIKITVHPMADPREPKESDMEFFASYAGKEADFQAWSKKVMFNFGAGFANGVMK